MNKIKINFVLYCILSLYPYTINAQSNFYYQILLETNFGYDNLDKNSTVNPENYMNIKKYNSISNLYPILKFENERSELNTLLQVEANIKNYNFRSDSTKFSFHELYTQFSLRDKHYLTFGKKRLNWGTGMIWNPTNFHTQKDPLRTQNRLDGIFMINYSFLFDNNALSFYVFPQEKTKDFIYSIKYDVSKYRINASISYLNYKRQQQFGYDISYGGDIFILYSEGVIKNYIKNFKIDKAGSLILPDSRNGNYNYELVVGGSAILNSKMNFRGEYRFRSSYLNKNEIKNYEQYIPDNILIYDAISISQHSVYINGEYNDIFDRWSFSLRSFYDPVSGQLVFSPLGTLKQDSFHLEFSTTFYNNKFPIYNFRSSILLSYYF